MLCCEHFTEGGTGCCLRVVWVEGAPWVVASGLVVFFSFFERHPSEREVGMAVRTVVRH